MMIAIYTGCPKIVRADRGTENVKIAFLQPFLRHQITGDSASHAFRYGRSISNQVYYLFSVIEIIPIIANLRESNAGGEIYMNGVLVFVSTFLRYRKKNNSH